MKRGIYIVTREEPDYEATSTEEFGHDHSHEYESKLPYEKAANALMSAKGYLDYVEKHDYHFTDKLADKVTKLMKNADESSHNWTAAQVKAALTGMGVKLPDNMTWGDVAYLANMYYADLFPEVLKTEADCLKAAAKIAHDPDGYKGMVFCRWTADAIGKAIELDWEEYV